MGNDIEFFASQLHLDAFPHPRPANKFFPKYFAKLKPQSGSHPSSGTVKRCVPFLDALSLGYIIPLWADVYVHAANGELNIEFPEHLPMDVSLSPHGLQQVQDHPLSKKPYGDIPLKWHNPWGITTPKGVSVLITSPLNHMETRFKILDGVVDTDNYYNQINFPFIWTGGDGEFIIPQGTPIAQVIPFRREGLNLSVHVEDKRKKDGVVAQISSVLKNAYRNKFWHKIGGKNV